MNESAHVLIQNATEKLDSILQPLIETDYPEISPELYSLIIRMVGTKMRVWIDLVETKLLPHRGMIEGPTPAGETVPLPQVLPGITLKPVTPETFEKVNRIFRFYLKLYDHLTKCQMTQT